MPLDRECHTSPVVEKSTPRTLRLLEGCDIAGLVQHVYQPTRGNSYLDLIMTNDACAEATVCEGTFPSDHAEIRCTVRVKKAAKRNVNRPTVYDYKRADFNGLRTSLSVSNWSMFDTLPVNEAVDLFYSKLEASIQDHIPTLTLKRRYPPWFDSDVRKALTEKESAYRSMKSNRNIDTMNRFRDCRKIFKKVSCMKYFEYLKDITGDFKSNPKRFWSFLKCVRGGKGQLPTLTDNTGDISGDVERADLLNRTFADKFSDPTVAFLPQAPNFDLPELVDFEVSASSISSILNNLNVHKASGPDNISARVIKECAVPLVAPIAIICKLSIEQGIFPSRWKEANIVPVFKKGSRKLPINYRAVSLIPFFGKILERVVRDRLFAHVKPALSEHQHGFLPGRSCETNLACLLSTAWNSITNGKQTDVIYTDFSSAFQSVNHQLLIHKLNISYSVGGQALKWCSSFLSDRKQRVVVNGKCSSWQSVTSGTPEGSLISPLLFALFVNDFPSQIQNRCLMFADDIKLYSEITNHSDTVCLQNDLTKLHDWSRTWHLKLNPGKCKSFCITLRRNPIIQHYVIGNTRLENVETIRDLGVILDRKLTFSHHIDTMVSKANKIMGIIMRSMQTGHKLGTFNWKSILTAYYGNVRAILEYCCVIWGGAANTHLNRIERVQHRFLQWLHFYSQDQIAPLSVDYSDLLHTFGVTSLESRRQQYDIMFVGKIYKSSIDSTALLDSFPLYAAPRPTRGTERTRGVMNVPFARVDTVRRSLFVRAPTHVNDCVFHCQDVDMFHDSLREFRAKVSAYIKQL